MLVCIVQLFYVFKIILLNENLFNNNISNTSSSHCIKSIIQLKYLEQGISFLIIYIAQIYITVTCSLLPSLSRSIHLDLFCVSKNELKRILIFFPKLSIILRPRFITHFLEKKKSHHLFPSSCRTTQNPTLSGYSVSRPALKSSPWASSFTKTRTYAMAGM